MNIRRQLLLERSKSNASLICSYIADTPARLQELMDCFFSKEDRVSQRAAMVVSKLFDRNPKSLADHLNKLIENLIENDVPVAIKRNTLRVLQFMEIPDSMQAPLFDRCLMFLSDEKEPIAIRAFSMTVLLNLCKKHQDLSAEVIPVLTVLLDHSESKGIQSRGRKVRKELELL